MSKDAQRQTGGASNKRGNRYEDHFVVARMIEYAPAVVEAGSVVRLKEQALCPVDDLVVREPGGSHYHQFKSGAATTWTAEGDKIADEFRAQRDACQTACEAARLYLVVPDEHRAGLLREACPNDLLRVAEVMVFPILPRPSALAGLALLTPAFGRLRASRFPRRNADEQLVGAFLLSYAEHAPDGDGYGVLADVVDDIRRRGLAAVRSSAAVSHPDWPQAEVALRALAGLEWWTDRGHFEWAFPPADRGEPFPVDGERFARFVARIVADPPADIEAFMRALP
jgi:hypothetical protein